MIIDAIRIPASSHAAPRKDFDGHRPAAAECANVPRTVVTVESTGSARSHDVVSRRNVAKRLAGFLGAGFGAHATTGSRAGVRTDTAAGVYYVPGDALPQHEARALGIRGPDDLFGGVVPRDFVATKSIVHPLGAPDAQRPEGWSERFAREVRPVVLDGESAFSRAGALDSIERMLRGGDVRLKRATGIGGRGQFVIRSPEEGRAALASLDERELASVGVVVEQNLRHVTTYSVGQVSVAGMVASYWGTQRTVRNHAGHEVYGGSSLQVARGSFADLLALDLPDDARRAVELSWHFDEAAFVHYAGLVASRRNYDVAIGLDAEGARRCGVLEQSWRIGGASAAEVLALEALRARPQVAEVRAVTVEAYADAIVPPQAFVYYDGDDGCGGSLVKFAFLEGDADA